MRDETPYCGEWSGRGTGFSDRILHPQGSQREANFGINTNNPQTDTHTQTHTQGIKVMPLGLILDGEPHI
jgi:hypothetical protein